MRILILGAGAIGGYIGGRLIQAGSEVVFIARGQRLEQLKNTGLVIKSPLGDLAGPVIASDAPMSKFVPDVIILTCKAQSLDESIAAIAPAVQERTRILPFLNGL